MQVPRNHIALTESSMGNRILRGSQEPTKGRILVASIWSLPLPMASTTILGKQKTAVDKWKLWRGVSNEVAGNLYTSWTPDLRGAAGNPRTSQTPVPKGVAESGF